MRVLYVDDNRINALLFVETCHGVTGVEVETAATGDEALDLVRRWLPDLLVIDLHLPDTTGYALLPVLRRQLGQPRLPAILCTADEAAVVAGPAQLAGFDGCWIKPVDVHLVRRELERRHSSKDAGAAA